MQVAVYRAAVPAKSKNQFKRDMLTAFAQGVAAAGDAVSLVDQQHTVDADIAVVQGWVGMKTGAHLALRKQVIDQQRSQGRHVMIIDSNLFGFLEPGDFNRYLRYSLDGIFPTTGYYFDNNIDTSRWPHIAASYGFVERPWRQRGKKILVCLQRVGGWSMDGQEVLSWLGSTIATIRAYTDRPILIRAHPGSLSVMPAVQKQHPDIQISHSADLRHDFESTWATVTYNSSPGVASVLWGIPAFVTDPCPQRSQAWPWVNTNLVDIDNPNTPDRTEFYHKLAQCHWLTADLASGAAWRFFKDRLPIRH
jgi:hypothetical protein